MRARAGFSPSRSRRSLPWPTISPRPSSSRRSRSPTSRRSSGFCSATSSMPKPDGEGLYFYADEGPADMIWLDRAPLEAALAQSSRPATTPRPPSSPSSSRAARRQCRDRTRLQRYGLGIHLSGHRAPLGKPALRHGRLGLYLLEHAPRRLRRHGCPDHPIAVIGKSTSDIIEDFLNEAVPGWADEPARA